MNDTFGRRLGARLTLVAAYALLVSGLPAFADNATAQTVQRPPAQGSTFRDSLKKPVKINKANQKRFAPPIERIARQHQLEPALVHAVISAESGYNPRAVSSKGAMGLMQLMPDTARRFGVTDPFDPEANIQGGVRYLRWLLNQFNSIKLAVAAYNAGENAVIRYRNNIPPYDETRIYVFRVINFYLYYRLIGIEEAASAKPG
ncbi:MAG: lytic transglycosylase domain-containing protein [Gammaproteobacteria bacterium]|nr:lytic transglycosylase domain-containing protein [Gammaproteobacteria bacterium]MCP5459897.1 lytic transglycosylase domain-containing protein [Gammaproteobacteria bacterium]